MTGRWYLKDKQKSETISKILAVLNGLTFKEASLILDCTANELAFKSFVCQDEAVYRQSVQMPNHSIDQILQE